MTSDDFIAELERRRLLSDRLIGKLRELLAGYDRPYTPEEVADFLVQKNHLTRDQADSILQSITGSGVNLFQAIAADLDDDPFAGSSIFSSHPPNASEKHAEPLRITDEDDEYRLAPIDEDNAASHTSGV